MPTASRKTAPHPISINRAPVLSLWAAVVAERLGYDTDEAATLGEAVSVLNARSKGRRLGIFAPTARDAGREDSGAGSTRHDEQLELLGRPVPVTRTGHGVRAMIGGGVLNPQRVRRKLEQKFGPNYETVRNAMEHVARSFRPAELAAAAYGMYERFRPTVPPGTRGWGARGDLDTDFIRSLAKLPTKARSANTRATTERPASHKGQQEADRPRRDTHPDRHRSRQAPRRTPSA